MPCKRSTDMPRRNQPCPCGSGQKYKRCHAPIDAADAKANQQRVERRVSLIGAFLLFLLSASVGVGLNQPGMFALGVLVSTILCVAALKKPRAPAEERRHIGRLHAAIDHLGHIDN